MNAKIEYTDEPLGELQVVPDFLPLSVEPQPRPRYNLDELLAQCDASAKVTSEEREWLDAKPAGSELNI